MDETFLATIEDAALNAWPASRHMHYDGWVLRFTGGDSKRVNSVNVRYQSKIPLSQKIRYCEAVYDQQGLPAIFRLPELFSSPGLEKALSQAGYTDFDKTFVLGRVLTSGAGLPVGVTVRQMSLEAFVQLRALVTGTPLSKWQIYQTILGVIVLERVLMGLFVEDQPVACGMGVLEGELLGYFSIYTSESMRCCGYGRGMMNALTQWGVDRGATYGYLQVEGDNVPALAMYEKLGFEHCYRYWYYKK